MFTIRNKNGLCLSRTSDNALKALPCEIPGAQAVKVTNQRWFRDVKTGRVRQAGTGQCVLLQYAQDMPLPASWNLSDCPSGQAPTLSFDSERLMFHVSKSDPEVCAENGQVCTGCDGTVFYGIKYKGFSFPSNIQPANFGEMKSEAHLSVNGKGRSLICTATSFPARNRCNSRY